MMKVCFRFMGVGNPHLFRVASTHFPPKIFPALSVVSDIIIEKSVCLFRSTAVWWSLHEAVQVEVSVCSISFSNLN